MSLFEVHNKSSTTCQMFSAPNFWCNRAGNSPWSFVPSCRDSNSPERRPSLRHLRRIHSIPSLHWRDGLKPNQGSESHLGLEGCTMPFPFRLHGLLSFRRQTAKNPSLPLVQFLGSTSSLSCGYCGTLPLKRGKSCHTASRFSNSRRLSPAPSKALRINTHRRLLRA